MPISFILLGIVLIFAIFYLSNKLLKTYIILVSLFLMCGYFIPPLAVENFSVNIIVLSIFLTLAALTNFMLGKKAVPILSYSLISALAYLILVKINNDFITILNPVPLVLIVFVVSLIQIKNPLKVIAYYSTSYLLINACNIILEQPLGGVALGDIELLNLMVISSFATIIISVIFLKIKVLQKRKI